MPVPKKAYHLNSEYKYTDDGRLVPKCATAHNPTYSKKAKELTKQLIAEGTAYAARMSSEVRTRSMTQEEQERYFGGGVGRRGKRST